MSTEEMKLFKIWDVSRSVKKMILTHATISSVLEEAKKKGISGTKIVLESDGTLVDEDVILNMCAEQPFIILDNIEDWVPTSSIISKDSSYNSDLIYLDLGAQTSVQSPPKLDVSLSQNERSNISQLSPLLPRTHTNFDSGSNSSSLPTTLSWSSGAFSENDNPNTNTAIKHTFENFAIPWNKFPKSILRICENNQKLGPQLRTVIHIIIDELRSISFYIPASIFRNIAAKLIAKYPKTFSFSDGNGNPIPILNSPLVTSMIHRNNYLNRPKANFNSSTPTILSRRRRLSKNLQESCINWEILPEDDENQEIIENNKKMLINFSSQKTYTKNEFEHIEKMMDQCFGSQRRFINNLEQPRTVPDIKKEWPLLLLKKFLIRHFHQLTQVDPRKVMEEFREKISKIMKYALHKKGKLLAETYQDGSEEDIAILRFVSKYFNENFDNILKFYPVGSSQQDIHPESSSPWVAVVETQGNPIYYLFGDHEVINTESTCVKEALIQLMCTYFNINREYPVSSSQTLEFCQRYFFEINSEKSRGTKRNMSNIAKIIRLIERVHEAGESNVE